MLPGKIKQRDSASHLALNLEVTQKEVGAGEGGATCCRQENYRVPRSLASLMNFCAQQRASQPIFPPESQASPSSVQVPTHETWIEHLGQELGFQGE